MDQNRVDGEIETLIKKEEKVSKKRRFQKRY